MEQFTIEQQEAWRLIRQGRLREVEPELAASVLKRIVYLSTGK
jgi:hypothetical protein